LNWFVLNTGVLNPALVQSGTISIPDGALSEGEKEIAKVIQYPECHVENLEKVP
jgi:hypothetical protein